MSKYTIKCSKGFVEYIETYGKDRQYGFTFDKIYAKIWTEKSIVRALREFKKITGLDAVKIEVKED